MACAFCGKKKGMFETFTKYSFCQSCNRKVRGSINRALDKLRRETPLCSPDYLDDKTTEELLTKIDELLEVTRKLEDLRQRVPFFKAGTTEFSKNLVSYQTQLKTGMLPDGRRLVGAADERARARRTLGEYFSALLDEVTTVTTEISADAKPRPPSAPVDDIIYSRVAKGEDVQKMGSFVSINVETTGTNQHKHDIVRISAMKFIDFRPTELFETYVLPPELITSKQEELCGITNDLLRGAPTMSEIVPALWRFMNGFHLVGYRLEFDLKFLSEKGFPIVREGRKFFDTYQIAQTVLEKTPSGWDKKLARRLGCELDYDVEDYDPETLCDYYGIIRDDEVRIGKDCLAIGLLFKMLVVSRNEPTLRRHAPQLTQAKEP